VPNPAIADASPLILLAKAGLLELLRLAGDPALVPSAVLQEIQAGDLTDPARLACAHTSWLKVVDPLTIPVQLAGFGLDPGEEAVLALAYANPGAEAVIDDQAARRCAKAMKIPFRGCVGLVIAARRVGMIPAARPVLEHLRSVGLRLTTRTMNNALALVGE
jgi:predicted nucleic acid-binding protein